MRKKFLSIIILVSFMLSAAVMNVSAIAAKPSNLLILGDSISTGYGLPGDKSTSKSFGNLLAKTFGLTAKSYTNLAVNGATSADLLSVVSSHSKAVSSADTIMISIGGNDLLGTFLSNIKAALGLSAGATIGQLQLAFFYNPNAVSLIGTQMQKAETQAQFAAAINNFDKNYTAVITAIRAVNPTAKICVQTVYNPVDDFPGFNKYASSIDPIALSLNSAIEKGAAAENCTVIDTYSAFKGKAMTLTNIASYDIHPNEAGHYVIFNAAYKAITGQNYAVPTPPSAKPTVPVSIKPTSPLSAKTTALSSVKPTANGKIANPATGGSAEIPIAVAALAVTFSCIGIVLFREKRID